MLERYFTIKNNGKIIIIKAIDEDEAGEKYINILLDGVRIKEATKDDIEWYKSFGGEIQD